MVVHRLALAAVFDVHQPHSKFSAVLHWHAVECDINVDRNQLDSMIVDGEVFDANLLLRGLAAAVDVAAVKRIVAAFGVRITYSG